MVAEAEADSAEAGLDAAVDALRSIWESPKRRIAYDGAESVSLSFLERTIQSKQEPNLIQMMSIQTES
jgi:hypothetical protein